MSYSATVSELFLPGADFAIAELTAMAMDGVLHQVYANVYRSALAVETPALRARALMSQVPASAATRAAISRRGAAWVYGVAEPPERIDLSISSSHRCGSTTAISSAVIHEVKMGPYDVQQLGGINVTSALRTAVDIVCNEDPEIAVPILLAFSESTTAPTLITTVHHALAIRAHSRGRRKGLRILETISQK